MKIQDILFFAVLGSMVLLRKPKLTAIVGLGCLVAAVPLFAFHVFFTAERLTWYAAAFFLVVILASLKNRE